MRVLSHISVTYQVKKRIKNLQCVLSLGGCILWYPILYELVKFLVKNGAVSIRFEPAKIVTTDREVKLVSLFVDMKVEDSKLLFARCRL